MNTSSKILDVQGLSVDLLLGSGARRPVLRDVSLSIEENRVLGIIGESGSGKTVLSRALINWVARPLEITGGKILYRGEDLVTLPQRQMQALRGRKIAYIGSDPGSALDPTIPIGHQIVEKLKAVEPGISTADAARRVVRMLDAVRIPSAAQRFQEFPFQFSGGMMQRVMIVDALVTQPDLLVADNITQPLDVTVAAQILRLLKDLQRDFNTAILFVSSSLGTLHDIADEVLVLSAGQVVEHQPFEDLLSAPKHPYTANLISDLPKIWEADTRNTGASIADKISDSEVVLSVRDISRVYSTKDPTKLFGKQHVHAVRGVSFDVHKGDSLGIVGESGCGKSSLSRLLSLLELPNTGQILFKGKDIARLNAKGQLDLRKRFQLLLQDPFNAIPPHFTIGRTIAEPLRIHGMAGSAIRPKVEQVMQEIGLSLDLHDKLPVGLSAGQRQRVNIARAMVLDPELLILDETLSALDQVEQTKLLALFEKLQRERGITLLYISHDLGMVRRVCNRVAVMYLGRVVELSDNQTTFFNPGHPYTRALLSAVPSIEARPYNPEKYLLEGEPPNPINIPPGCSFRTRCPFAIEKCATIDPVLTPRAGEAFAACHLAKIVEAA
ncbi:ABC transporter ATP-binding protein [Shinella sp. DD12]|uniref:dipeptide ABC transporter ATP-binding protein n=1 Tax=Shinella sp. DD12 TaxID=1410620 RepID=UPI0003C56058|nr:ABC transporter ATP-binding protein [Shinella sp. DD12]EYR81116.1 glutathione import ATP-binding protein GsiA [Shinella sp. DD12]